MHRGGGFGPVYRGVGLKRIILWEYILVCQLELDGEP